jgi:signal peptidase II
LKRHQFVLLIIICVLIADQILKMWIKTHLTYGEEFGILGLSWARIHFVENEGMAFGLSFGGPEGKLALSIFRVFAAIFLVYILRTLVKAKESFGLLTCFALITAGAIGNILDSAFYGLIFSDSSYHGGIAQFLPPEGGYAGLFFGKVVDMLYFPLIDTMLPDWVPLWGGERFHFFKPVFNLADAAIYTGVFSLLVFYTRFFR